VSNLQPNQVRGWFFQWIAGDAKVDDEKLVRIAHLDTPCSQPGVSPSQSVDVMAMRDALNEPRLLQIVAREVGHG
jgi:hypothetical protein